MEVLMTQPLVWVIAVVILCVGVLIGVALRPHQDKKRAKELEATLQESREELVQYRGQVAQHFAQTADLLHAMTANYRAVYEHLAQGAQSLCDGQVRTLNAAALSERLLPAESPSPVSVELAESSDTVSVEPHNSLDPVPDETAIGQQSSPLEDFSPALSATQEQERRDATERI